jgi:hypothetical protein
MLIAIRLGLKQFLIGNFMLRYSPCFYVST